MGKLIKNEDYFEKIDTEHKAYWLGLLYADGSMTIRKNSYNLSITLKAEDGYLLEQFLEDLETDYKIRYTSHKVKGKQYPVARVSICNTKLGKDLVNKGIRPNKTTDCIFPKEDIIQSYLVKHFIRGFMDGDGSIKRVEYKDYSLNFIGTKEMLIPIYNFFKEQNSEIRETPNLILEKKCEVEIYTLEFHGNLITQRLLKLLYENSNIHMVRKYEKYIDLINQIEYEYYEKLEKIYGRYALVLDNWEYGKTYEVLEKETNLCVTVLEPIIQPIRNLKQAKIDEYIVEKLKLGQSKLSLQNETGRSRDYIRKLAKQYV